MIVIKKENARAGNTSPNKNMRKVLGISLVLCVLSLGFVLILAN